MMKQVNPVKLPPTSASPQTLEAPLIRKPIPALCNFRSDPQLGYGYAVRLDRTTHRNARCCAAVASQHGDNHCPYGSRSLEHHSRLNGVRSAATATIGLDSVGEFTITTQSTHDGDVHGQLAGIAHLADVSAWDQLSRRW